MSSELLQVHLVGKDLQEFADEGAGNERDHQKESPMAKRRKLNVAGWYSFARLKGIT